MSGTPYRWNNVATKVADLPARLIDVVNNRPTNSRIRIEDYVHEGNRNNYLTCAGGKARHEDMKEKDLHMYQKEESLIKCKPPLSEAEVSKIGKSISKYQPGEEHFLFAWKKAFMHSDLSRNSRLLLFTLAYHMNTNGRNCYPSQVLLASETNMTRKTVSKHTKICVDHGFLKTYTNSSDCHQYWNYGYIARITDE
jgi:DNA-binding MarR family transcriptional regulator